MPSPDAGLPISATIMVLGAAVAHASWNAIAHAIEDKLVGLTLLCLGGAGLSIPLMVFSPLPAPASWPWLIASVVVHLAYQGLLMASYHLGDFGQVYPIARGSAPLLVTGIAALFLHEIPQPFELTGVVVISVGLASLVFAGGRLPRADLKPVAAALATGLTIATYTTIDGTGVRASDTPAGYAGWLIFLSFGITLVYTGLRRGPTLLLRQIRPKLALGLFSGTLGLAGYGLVLWAQTKGPLAAVSALRETSIVVGAIISALIFKESFGIRRIAATLVVFGGIVLINLA